jgi:hypothetical protein
MKQISFFNQQSNNKSNDKQNKRKSPPSNQQNRKGFGGSLLQGQRKSARPLSPRAPIHLILKSEQARDGKSFIRNQIIVRRELKRWARRFYIEILAVSVNGNHIHLCLRVKMRENYHRFIRALTSRLSHLLKIKWTLRPWSRLISMGMDLKNVIEYLKLNQKEAIGSVPYQKRGEPRLLEWNQIENYFKKHFLAS